MPPRPLLCFPARIWWDSALKHESLERTGGLFVLASLLTAMDQLFRAAASRAGWAFPLFGVIDEDTHVLRCTRCAQIQVQQPLNRRMNHFAADFERVLVVEDDGNVCRCAWFIRLV
jgi:hypothetical protein